MDTKPFNAEHAKAGAKYGCADGSTADILKYGPTKMWGTITNDEGEEFAAGWTLDGVKCSGVMSSEKRLVMLPLGQIDGKPVWADSKIITQHDCEIEALAWFRQGEPFDGSRWPAPAKQYPQTKMADQELYAPDSLRATANAALRHACESGQVVPMPEVQEVARNLAAKRELAAAEAVWAKCLAVSAPARGYEMSEDASEIIASIAGLDLPAIIATVKESA
jgi:hypothetical protein